jgi:hypothetical protein
MIRGADDMPARAGEVSCCSMSKGRARRYILLRAQEMASSFSRPAFMQSILTREADELRSALATVTPGNPAAAGFKSYSQNDEDGILEEIFERIGDGERTFAELGCGNGLENNSHLLLLKGWRGVWVDGEPKNIAFIAKHLPLCTPRLSVVEAFVTRENAGEVVSGGLRQVGSSMGALDLLSIDLDGNDLEILSALLELAEPRVLCVEYNAKFPLPLEVELPYDPAHAWQGDDYQGASLGSFLRRLSDRYSLVACNVCGVNAFFVRNDLASSFTSYTADELYQPARYHLIAIPAGHPPSLKFLAASLRGAGPVTTADRRAGARSDGG